MLHKMKLNESPFERIKNGTKAIEFRLYDENNIFFNSIMEFAEVSTFDPSKIITLEV